MFPGIIPETFSTSFSKITYSVSESVSPYLDIPNIEDFKKSSSPFIVYYTETTNKQVEKQFHIKIKFWSENESVIKTRHLKTHLIGHATGVLVLVFS